MLEVHQYPQPVGGRDLLPLHGRGLYHMKFLVSGEGPTCLWTVTHKMYCSRRRVYAFVDLQGLGTDHVTWFWGTEVDLCNVMAKHLIDIATYRLN